MWHDFVAPVASPHAVQVEVPPASTVRKFLALLEQSDIDFSEELGQ